MMLIRFISLFLSLCFSINTGSAQETLDVRIAFLTQEEEVRLSLSLLDPEIDDYGLPGAHQANKENQTTGTFTKQKFELIEAIVPEDGNLVKTFTELVEQSIGLFVADLPAQSLLKIADTDIAKGVLIFNTRAQDDSLRNEDCRSNILHIAPSRAMLADALAQYLVWKRWNRWSLLLEKCPKIKRLRRQSNDLLSVSARKSLMKSNGLSMPEQDAQTRVM